MEDLKRCPFCNGKAYLDQNTYVTEEGEEYNSSTYSVNCCNCDCTLEGDEKEVVSNWNRRVNLKESEDE